MTIMNISSRPVIDEDLGTVTQKVLSLNKKTGKAEKIEIKLEESRFNTVSNIAAEKIKLPFIVDDLTSQIKDDKISYSTNNVFEAGSLCVYLNGLQIVLDISENEDRNGFSLTDDYIGIIKKDEDSITATYVKEVDVS